MAGAKQTPHTELHQQGVDNTLHDAAEEGHEHGDRVLFDEGVQVLKRGNGLQSVYYCRDQRRKNNADEYSQEAT